MYWSLDNQSTAKAQKSVKLSSSEAEWATLSEAVNETMFMIQLLGSMKILVKLQVTVRFINVGAIFMASNITTMSHTKHVDIRYKYINEYVEDRVVKIFIVKSAKNDSNILTKNLNVGLHEKLTKKMIGEKLEENFRFGNT